MKFFQTKRRENPKSTDASESARHASDVGSLKMFEAELETAISPSRGAPHPPGGTGICMKAAMICESGCATLLRVGWLCQRRWRPPPTARTGDQEKQTDQSAPPAPLQPTHVGTKRGARSGSPPALPKGSRGAFRSKSAGEKKPETRESRLVVRRFLTLMPTPILFLNGLIAQLVRAYG